MTGEVIGFIIWLMCGCLFIGIGIRAFTDSKKPMEFWANIKMFEVTDVKKYNRAVGKLFCAYGMVLIMFGIPLLAAGQNSPWILLSVIGVMLETIAAMVVYTVVIEKKYKNRV